MLSAACMPHLPFPFTFHLILKLMVNIRLFFYSIKWHYFPFPQCIDIDMYTNICAYIICMFSNLETVCFPMLLTNIRDVGYSYSLCLHSFPICSVLVLMLLFWSVLLSDSFMSPSLKWLASSFCARNDCIFILE